MPTQLYNNTNISFVCGRNFVWEGKKYSMGDEWDQDISVGRIDTLVRSRYLYAVVDSKEDKPRHWHHQVHVRSDLDTRLGITRELGQSSIATRAPQGLAEPTTQDYDALTPWEETKDNGEALRLKAAEAYETARVLAQNNDDTPEEKKGVVGQTEPEELVLDEEHATKETDERVAEVNDAEAERQEQIDALYDPAEHNVDSVLDYLTGDITDEERDRVVASERVNKARKGILDNL